MMEIYFGENEVRKEVFVEVDYVFLIYNILLIILGYCLVCLKKKVVSLFDLLIEECSEFFQFVRLVI